MGVSGNDKWWALVNMVTKMSSYVKYVGNMVTSR
jgi:hypothetical protein